MVCTDYSGSLVRIYRMGHKTAFRFARVLVILSLALLCILLGVCEQLVNSRAVSMLRYTRCNIVILMAATVWLMLSFISCISPPPPPPPWGWINFLWGHLKTTVYESNPHTIQELKDISHAVAAINIPMLRRVYLNMIRRAQLCIDAGGNHSQHLLLWYILSAFGYCINFCIYAMLRTRATFPWPILYYAV